MILYAFLLYKYSNDTYIYDGLPIRDGWEIITSFLSRHKVSNCVSIPLLVRRDLVKYMKINNRLVGVLLVITVAGGILSGIDPYFPLYLGGVRGMHSADVAVVLSFVAVIYYAIDPLTLFAISFLVGRSLEVTVELRTIVVSIYLSCFLGSFVGWQLGSAIMMYVARAPFNVVYNILGGTFHNLISAINLFFVSFSAIAIASILKHHAVAKNEASELAS